MIKNIVCNSSGIIALERIGHLEILLKSFETIFIPEAVEKEIGNKIKGVSVKKVYDYPISSAKKIIKKTIFSFISPLIAQHVTHFSPNMID